MTAAETDTVADQPAPAAMAAEEARKAYADLLRSLHALIHFADASSEPVAESLLRLTEAWAAYQLANDNDLLDLPLARPGVRDFIRTLLGIARYSRPDDPLLAELAESFREATTTS
jgi:hypothetical protein